MEGGLTVNGMAGMMCQQLHTSRVPRPCTVCPGMPPIYIIINPTNLHVPNLHHYFDIYSAEFMPAAFFFLRLQLYCDKKLYDKFCAHLPLPSRMTTLLHIVAPCTYSQQYAFHETDTFIRE